MYGDRNVLSTACRAPQACACSATQAMSTIRSSGFEGVSVSFGNGHRYGLIGANGCGKSTFMKILAGELEPTAGNVSTDPNARVGQLRQDQFAYEDVRVLDVVMMGLYGRLGWIRRPGRAEREEAMQALTDVGMQDFADRQISQLSGGQQQRVFLARALVQAADLYFLDEPMAGLGAEGTKGLTAFLDTLRDEAPILLVEHDMDAVFALADRISVLVYGAVIATGTAEEIRADPVVREAYLGEDAT